MRRQLADVGEGEVAVAAQNHRAEIAATAKDARQVCRRKVVFIQQVFQHVHALDSLCANITSFFLNNS
jgi:hypothetical protein